MLFDNIRIFKYTGTLTDLSIENQDKTIDIAAALTTAQYIYIAQKLPFNSLFFLMDVVNSNAASLVVEYWNGSEWKQAVDLLDSTKVSGVTLSRSGHLVWSLHKDYAWNSISDTSLSESPAHLQSVSVYDYYWIRISPSANLSAGTEIKEISYAFTNSQFMKTIDVEIDTFWSAFATGKTDWNDEIITASKMLIIDLKNLGLVDFRGQILQQEDVAMACTYKTVELIYMNLGPSYKDKRDELRVEYSKALSPKRITVDSNKNGRFEKSELFNRVRTVTR